MRIERRGAVQALEWVGASSTGDGNVLRWEHEAARLRKEAPFGASREQADRSGKSAARGRKSGGAMARTPLFLSAARRCTLVDKPRTILDQKNEHLA